MRKTTTCDPGHTHPMTGADNARADAIRAKFARLREIADQPSIGPAKDEADAILFDIAEEAAVAVLRIAEATERTAAAVEALLHAGAVRR